jgi:mRNA interferase RelE/StbE
VPDELADLIREMHPSLKKKVRASLDMILSDPQKGKALKEEFAGLHSFRVGNFRIIYQISRKHVEIVALGPREEIYGEIFLILKGEGPSEIGSDRQSHHHLFYKSPLFSSMGGVNGQGGGRKTRLRKWENPFSSPHRRS